MGQAKHRGSFDQRKAEAIERKIQETATKQQEQILVGGSTANSQFKQALAFALGLSATSMLPNILNDELKKNK